MPEPRFLVYSRDGCALCDEFVAELGPVLAGRGIAWEIRDVDADETSRRRYGHQVPVLTCDGSVVCRGHLDRAALARLTAA